MNKVAGAALAFARDDAAELATYSQWRLIRRRFARHRLAVFSLYLLFAFYGIALLAPFLAPYTRNAKKFDYT